MLEELGSMISNYRRRLFWGIRTPHHGQLRPTKNSIEIKVGDLKLLLKLLLSQEGPLRPGSVLRHHISSCEDQRKKQTEIPGFGESRMAAS